MRMNKTFWIWTLKNWPESERELLDIRLPMVMMVLQKSRYSIFLRRFFLS